jgi:uncharacterized protein (TIGR02271 family)
MSLLHGLFKALHRRAWCKAVAPGLAVRTAQPHPPPIRLDLLPLKRVHQEAATGFAAPQGSLTARHGRTVWLSLRTDPRASLVPVQSTVGSRESACLLLPERWVGAGRHSTRGAIVIGTRDIEALNGWDVFGSDGEKIGSIDQVYVDDETERPEFVLMRSGFFGTKLHFVPLRDANESDGTITVPYTKERVKDAPSMDPDGHLSQDEEARLYSYYDLDYSERRSDTGLPEGGRSETATTGRTGADDAMTRSEEQVKVGTRKQEAGRVRLRKYVTTENVTQTVPVKKEKVRLEREPITDANRAEATDGPEITENVHEEVLREEEPVVEKRVVPKERVRLEKDVETDEEQISEQVRKERIEVDDTTKRS